MLKAEWNKNIEIWKHSYRWQRSMDNSDVNLIIYVKYLYLHCTQKKKSLKPNVE